MHPLFGTTGTGRFDAHALGMDEGAREVGATDVRVELPASNPATIPQVARAPLTLVQ